MRFIGLDVHRDSCDVAIYEDGEVRSAGRVETSPEQLQLFACAKRTRREAKRQG